MRDIKFRALDSIGDGHWRYGYVFHNGKFWAIKDGIVTVGVREETIGQYTGLKDRNGKEIYEGDVLRYLEEAYRVDEIVPVHRDSHVTNIGFWSGRKYFHRTPASAYDNQDDWMSWPDMYEVIGNIYENPDLLPPNE